MGMGKWHLAGAKIPPILDLFQLPKAIARVAALSIDRASHLFSGH